MQDGSENAVTATRKDTIVEPVPFDIKDYFSFLVSNIVFSGTFIFFLPSIGATPITCVEKHT